MTSNKKLIIYYDVTPGEENFTVEMNYYDAEKDILRSSGCNFVLSSASQISEFKETRGDFKLKIDRAFVFGNYLKHAYDIIYQLHLENKEKNPEAILGSA